MVHPGAAGGYACALAAVLYRGGATHAGFDLPRFARESEARLADPWDVDPGSFASVVLEARFRADHLNAPGRVAVELTGIPCALSSDSPWGTAIEPDGLGAATAYIAPGRVHRWLGGGYLLSVYLSASGEAAWTLSPAIP
jgi:hypothetical protein